MTLEASGKFSGALVSAFPQGTPAGELSENTVDRISGVSSLIAQGWKELPPSPGMGCSPTVLGREGRSTQDLVVCRFPWG